MDLKNFKEQAQMNGLNSVSSSQFTPTASYRDICPCCGYCRHCGRQNNYPYVPYQPAPWYPTTWGGGGWTGTVTSGQWSYVQVPQNRNKL